MSSKDWHSRSKTILHKRLVTHLHYTLSDLRFTRILFIRKLYFLQVINIYFIGTFEKIYVLDLSHFKTFFIKICSSSYIFIKLKRLVFIRSQKFILSFSYVFIVKLKIRKRLRFNSEFLRTHTNPSFF
ncbi:hypothetical protein LEP1GSC127_2758 [Leptospira kirschneri str. 200801925]|nr:hypothetical protein LEP1GSC127_2758 [Leptospira kirschneri str. 200801925]